MGWFDRLKSGLKSSSDKLKDGITSIFTKTKLSDEVLEEFEELLIRSDIGVGLAGSIIAKLSEEKFNKEITPGEIEDFLKSFLSEKFKAVPDYQHNWPLNEPRIVMVCGVNGNGKTTTIGKLANSYKNDGKKVMMAAADTFRAAAVEQLEVWAQRCGIELIKCAENADPASVAHKAVTRAINENVDLLLIDTAGRLHNKTNLMDELKKINNVIAKILPGSPHDTFLVLDATTGQNALSQVQHFREAANITGLIITKLDGTAKAGILLSIMDKYKIPVVAIGVGEKIEDLQPFNFEDFIDNLLSK